MKRRTFLHHTSLGVSVLAIPGLSCSSTDEDKAVGQLAATGRPSYRVGSEHLIFGPNGSRFVLDPESHAVHRGEHKTVEASFTSLGDRASEVNFPIDAAVGADGRLYVVDHGNDRVVIFDAKGLRLGDVGGMRRPRGVIVLRNGHLAACDVAGHAVQRFTADGQPASRLTGDGQNPLNGPCALAEDPLGNLHVVDAGNCRVVVLSYKGEVVRTYGSHGAGEGQLLMPRAIAIDGHGRVCVGEAATGFIHVFDMEGRFLERFLPIGPGGDPVAPLELSFDPNGELYIWAPGTHAPMALVNA
ncbi:MAG: NHL repeat-containing protein [Planctomycetota bacterium]|nr:NHL repeat-containing protein [Planctomycetota bacterium]